MAQICEAWICDDCGEIHDCEDEARDCCPPSIRHRWRCCGCDELHGSAAEAEDCCDDENAPPMGPTPAELEAAGQMRLAL